MRGFTKFGLFGTGSAAALALWLAATPVIAQEQARDFNIPAGDLGPALNAYARQADREIMFSSEAVAGKRTAGLRGRYEPQVALDRLLAGSGMIVISRENGVITLGVARFPTSQKAPANETTTVGELIVTGTNIRGLTNSPSPVASFTRSDIDQAGVSNVAQFMQRLPQNFAGVASEDTIQNVAGGSAAGQNYALGTGVNLRGLGPDSTLVLVNGRRFAAANFTGNFVDLSLIPLAAVERVEIVPDGASAIYGSDAVGGVVNFLLKRNFAGSETRARFGVDSSGNMPEHQLSHTIGFEWGSGSSVLSYEYSHRGELTVEDRSYTASAPRPFTLIPEMTRNGVFASVEENVTDELRLFAQGTYSTRSSLSFLSAPGNGIVQRTSPRLDAYSVTAGGQLVLPKDFELELTSTYATTNSDLPSTDPRTGAFVSDVEINTSIFSADAKMDGPIWTSPAGPVLVALGAQFRQEGFDQDGRVNRGDFDTTRDIVAAFAELRAPVIGPPESGSATNRLELSLAGRVERYSDFGSTVNPKVGWVWLPTTDLKLRGTFGKSFKAPLLSDLNPTPLSVLAHRVTDPTTNSEIIAFTTFGSNPELGPERATTWTVGADFNSTQLPGLRASVTYYNINFRDRISNLSDAGLFGTSVLENEASLGSKLVQRNPPASLLQSLFEGGPIFVDLINCFCVADPSTFDLSTVAVFIDSRSQNFAEVKTDGLDFSLSYETDLPAGRVGVGVDGTYIFRFRAKTLPTTPEVSLLDSPYNPIDLKLRGRLTFTRGGFSAAAFLNYIDAYTDNRGATPTKVEAWATLDATVGYQFNSLSGPLSGVSVVFGATNVTNEDPPFVRSGDPFNFPGINFDGANANVRGRVISFEATKRW